MAYYIFPNAVSKEQCKIYLDYCLNNVKFKQATVVKNNTDDFHLGEDGEISDIGEDGEISDIRNTSVGFLDYSHDLINNVVWSYIREANENFFKYDLNFFQEIQFAKYEVGDYYEWHQDSSGSRKVAECRKLSLTMSLTDDTEYEGGHLQFFNGHRPHEVENPGVLKHKDIERDIKSVGSVVVFDSSDWHRVTPVTKGVRYSLVCWCVGPNFV